MFNRRNTLNVLTGVISTLALSVKVGIAESDFASLMSPMHVALKSSFVSPLVDLFGDVSVGKKTFVAGNTTLRAPGTRICLGNETNLQDNIRFVALRKAPAPAAQCGSKSSSTQNRVSIAHQASITNSKIGNFTFVGFRTRLTNSILEDGAFVLHGATVTGVRIPKDRIVPIGAMITTQAQANALEKTEANSEFQEEVLEVNEEFAEHYPELYKEGGYDAVTGVSPAPKTS